MRPYLDKIGSFGAILAAAACPVCFPKLAALAAIFGFGALGAYEGQLFLAAKLLVVVSVVGHVLSYFQHRRAWVLALALAGGAAFFAGLYVFDSELLIYAGFAGLVIASSVDAFKRLRPMRNSPEVPQLSPQLYLESTLTCPKCGFKKTEAMPTDACQFFYTCEGCGAQLKPLKGDCCVFCSYGSVKCPPMQQKACCA